MTTTEAPAGIQLLLDKDAIVELHDRFAAVLDAADWDALAGLFTRDSVVEGWSKRPGVQGRWEGIEEIVRQYRDISGEHKASQRMITNHRVEIDGDRARSAATYRSHHLNAPEDSAPPSAHSHEGWYLSELVRTGEGWRFSFVKHVILNKALNTTPEGRAMIEEIYRGALGK